MDNVFGQQANAQASQAAAAAAAQDSIAGTAQASADNTAAFNEALTQADADKSVTNGEANIAQGDLNHIDQMTQAQAR